MVMDLKVLAIHLKRFTYNERLDRLTKLSHRVVFPFELRLSNTTDDAEAADTAYDLASNKHTHRETRHAHAQTRTRTDRHTYRHTCVYIYIHFGKQISFPDICQCIENSGRGNGEPPFREASVCFICY